MLISEKQVAHQGSYSYPYNAPLIYVYAVIAGYRMKECLLQDSKFVISNPFVSLNGNDVGTRFKQFPVQPDFVFKFMYWLLMDQSTAHIQNKQAGVFPGFFNSDH
jgi:hypothetical protein